MARRGGRPVPEVNICSDLFVRITGSSAQPTSPTRRRVQRIYATASTQRRVPTPPTENAGMMRSIRHRATVSGRVHDAADAECGDDAQCASRDAAARVVVDRQAEQMQGRGE